ncbi:MAG: hypothetical protein ACOX45_10185 [Acutalibacteraceae bacterium]
MIVAWIVALPAHILITFAAVSRPESITVICSELSQVNATKSRIGRPKQIVQSFPKITLGTMTSADFLPFVVTTDFSADKTSRGKT